MPGPAVDEGEPFAAGRSPAHQGRVFGEERVEGIPLRALDLVGRVLEHRLQAGADVVDVAVEMVVSRQGEAGGAARAGGPPVSVEPRQGFRDGAAVGLGARRVEAVGVGL